MFRPVGLLPVSSSLSLLWNPNSVGLGMREQIRLCAVSLLLALLQQGFPRSPMISVFISRRRDIKVVKKAVGEYEQIARAKVNFDKIGGVAIPFQVPSAGVIDPSASSGCESGPTSN